ncbi:MAG: hypothetical protein K1X64_10905 [Myxococcaceae bacterium]|nr:hypothetical protein [Myxococcaceae bacterium]
MIEKKSVKHSQQALLQVVLGLAMMVILALCSSACGGAPVGFEGEMEELSDTVSPGVAAQQVQPPLLSSGWVFSPRCAEDEFVCAGACANLNSDSYHCGGCGHACEVGKHCQLGECVTECPP